MKKGQKAKFSVKKNRKTGRYTKINKLTYQIKSSISGFYNILMVSVCIKFVGLKSCICIEFVRLKHDICIVFVRLKHYICIEYVRLKHDVCIVFVRLK